MSRKVYKAPVSDLDDLKVRITNAIANVDGDMLQQVRKKMEYLLDVVQYVPP